MGLLWSVAGLSLGDKVRSLAIRERLRVELLLLQIERNQLGWFCHLTGSSPMRFQGEVFQTCPTGRSPQGRPRTRQRDYSFNLSLYLPGRAGRGGLDCCRCHLGPDEWKQIVLITYSWRLTSYMKKRCCIQFSMLFIDLYLIMSLVIDAVQKNPSQRMLQMLLFMWAHVEPEAERFNKESFQSLLWYLLSLTWVLGCVHPANAEKPRLFWTGFAVHPSRYVEICIFNLTSCHQSTCELWMADQKKKQAIKALFPSVLCQFTLNNQPCPPRLISMVVKTLLLLIRARIMLPGGSLC